MEAVSKRAPGARLDGVLVAEMVAGGLELAAGLVCDPEFGLSLMLGAGGTLVEWLADATFKLPPLGAQGAQAMLERLRVASLLNGVRGSARFDRAALHVALVELSRLARDLGESIEEMDINPLVVLPEGQGCRILDAVIICRRPPAA